ncbi:hypothetical protein BUALT_Bualt03G0051800 [Buddleja alternifolia]|uniref:Uncharacterized protein n=1 Tax=Buddleja alternifolia TaxID=168488 RepID=A0AAV6Y2H6_9LAMI|nr:hypothetical protein BUALT_Bualt03G0051800 [Buddleja alternifolia]
MAGTVYLRTNRFEVKLEGITFKTKDFESLCGMDFLFPDGKIWIRPPIVGLDVMRHPRDPSILLLLLCFGIGCVILRLGAGEALPAPIHKFLGDKRIHFVGFGIPEKKDLFPFDELGLTINKVDIGYLAAKMLDDPKYKKWELAQLAREVLGIKRMIGLTEASSFERHEQIKCAICQLFITSVIGMGLLGANDNKKLEKSYFKRSSSFLKNLNSLQNLTEGWFKLPIGKKKNRVGQDSPPVMLGDDIVANAKRKEEHAVNRLLNAKCKEDYFINYFLNDKIPEGDSEDDMKDAKIKEDLFGKIDDLCDPVACVEKKDKNGISSDDMGKEASPTAKKPLKGILRCPSTTLQRSYSSPCMPTSLPSTPRSQTTNGAVLKRANSKGCNVSFMCH